MTGNNRTDECWNCDKPNAGYQCSDCGEYAQDKPKQRKEVSA